MVENSIEEDIEILEEKMNKELDFLIENANKTEQLTAISIIAMKEPIILLFLSILSDYKRVLKDNEEFKRLHIQDNKHLDFIMQHSIPAQKVKDKIEHYQKLQDNYIEKYDEINEGLQAMINALQELLEGRK